MLSPRALAAEAEQVTVVVRLAWLVGNGGMGYNYNYYCYHSSIRY